jgi:hypothetical protein
MYEQLNDGTFNIINSAVPNDLAISYSNAIGDTDNDGYPEIVVNNINHDNIFLWKNTSTSSNNWLKVKLEGTQSNRDAVGSLIEISVNGQKQYRYTLCGEGYLSQNSSSEFFGVGNATTVDYIKVKWLSGIVDILYDVSVNEEIFILERSTLSVSDNDLLDLKAFPNPTKSLINITSSTHIQNVEIISFLGQSVLKFNPNSQNFSINLNGLSDGVYFADLSSANSSKRIKIVKH